MKGLILASGMGRRLAEHFPETPKCLLPLGNGETIIDRQLKAFRSVGISDVIITTGFLADKISDFVSSEYSDLTFRFIENIKYAATNYIYSLYLCHKYIDSDFVLVHADMVFDEKLFQQLADSVSSAVLVRNSKPTIADEKDFKGLVKNGRVQRISVDLTGEDSLPLAPVYKFSQKDISAWFLRINEFIEAGDVSCYAENALNEVLGEVNLRALFYTDKLCGEVDTLNDLINIKKQLAVL